MLIDSHAHLDMEEFDKDRSDVLARAVEGGITHIISVGIDLSSSRACLELTKTHDYIYASVGYHPHNADRCDLSDLEHIAEMALESKVVAWGEIGLDFYRNYSSAEKQFTFFKRQLELADDLNLPVIIHDREAHADVLSILKKMGKGKRRGVIHCYSGDMELAEAFLDLGYYISIPGTVTYKNALTIKEVAAEIPLDRLLVETDAPFLSPVPKRGKRNEPLFVTYTAEEIARLKHTTLETLGLETSENAKALFALS